MFRRLIRHGAAVLIYSLVGFTASANNWQAFDQNSAWLQQLSMGQEGLYRAHFNQARHLQIMQQPLLSSGEVILKAEQGLIWQQLKPFQQTLVVSASQVSQYDRDAQPMQLPVAAQQMIQAWAPMMQQVILGQWSALEQRFEVRLAEGSNIEHWQMQLTPRDQQMQAALANIELSGGQQLQDIAIYQQNGDVLRIELEQQAWQALNPQQQSWLND
ncbi:LolA family protein [Agarivorans gilvus]|jgi:hypothetical protein|uniref:Outer membrane lipoprotein carrier protein LolA n=1 Tax=Agarivorans gilvus TaxID=680279 RepID=A0ABQ1I2H7_9ALTE|nr:outer membrane lipoprotein carrier protein LolA [Agarivorans gilvus]GGB07930.1 hypothetical protein GCM10007414_21640 [Agarivorans gilvus]